MTQSNSIKHTENILEGYLNGGEIITSNIDTNILGNTDNSYNYYKTKLDKIIDNFNISVYYPILYTSMLI